MVDTGICGMVDTGICWVADTGIYIIIIIIIKLRKEGTACVP